MSDISFPVLSETIPFWAVGIYCTIPPIILIILVELGNAKLYPFQSRDDEPIGVFIRKFAILAFHAISLFVFGIGIVLLLTELGKRWIGRF